MTKEDYFKYYIQGSDHYLIPKDVFKELFNEMVNWKEESQKKKEAIDKAIETLDNYQNNLYSKSAREFLDDDIERTITILKEVK
ncbi:MAG: hypothetical protein PUJ92_06160 [Bacilli bacterium]|nr:hypothetical protein [Bacilli bacterium]MDY5832054.1 hypothetical protein [Candidatus Onthovivens sp.]